MFRVHHIVSNMYHSICKWKMVIVSTVVLIILLYLPALTQNNEETSSKARVHNGFSIYSSENHSNVNIHNLAEWEQYRWQLKRNMEAIMGPLPDRQNLPELNIRIKDSLRTDSYLRLTLDFLAANGDKLSGAEPSSRNGVEGGTLSGVEGGTLSGVEGGTLSGVEGERVPAYLYLPHRSSITGKSPAILALHPTGADGKKIVDGQGKANRGYARELAERGYIVIAPDYPSFGDLSDYDFTTDRYQSGTMAAIFYHMRCVDLLLDREDVDPERIGVIGHSLGGHNAIFVGAFDERLKVVVSSSGWTQMEYYDIGPAASEQYGGRLGPYAQERYMPLVREKYQLDGDRIPINYHEMIALLAPRAFFSNSPLNDANFEVKGVRKGMEMVRGVYHFLQADDLLQVRYPEAEHDFPTEVRLEAYEFIDQVLHHIPSQHEIEYK